LYGAFALGLRALGYAEGRNLVVERRHADGAYERLPALAAELARMNLAVLTTYGTPAAKAAHEATTTTPIVAISAVDLVGNGLAKNLAQPGGNVTGLAVIDGDVSRKHLDLMRAALPKLSRVAVLLNPGNAANGTAWRNVQAAGRAVQIAVSPVHARTTDDIATGFATMVRDEVGAGIVAADAFFAVKAPLIAELATKHRIPMIGSDREYVAAGLLMSYGQNMAEFHRRAAWYVDRILKGAKPATLPVEEPTKIELAINRKTASTLGITLPQELLQRADEVIA
jgi:putative ABC transport system substrate-binding protein